MEVGFTGTRLGMTEAQKRQLRKILELIVSGTFHHGMCVGADEQAHYIAKEMGFKPIGHPPIVQSHMMVYDPQDFDYIYLPGKYLERNHDIATHSDLLIATPKGEFEEKRSGTWSTVRYANILHRTIVIIKPAGNITYIN